MDDVSFFDDFLGFMKMIHEFRQALEELTVSHTLTFGEVVNWFIQREHLVEDGMENIAFTVLETGHHSKYATFQGIYSQKRKQILEGRVIESEAIDRRLAEIHKEHPVAVYS